MKNTNIKKQFEDNYSLIYFPRYLTPAQGLIKTKTNHKTSFLQVLTDCYPLLFLYCKYTVPLSETYLSCQGLLSRGQPSLISVEITLSYPCENPALILPNNYIEDID